MTATLSRETLLYANRLQGFCADVSYCTRWFTFHAGRIEAINGAPEAESAIGPRDEAVEFCERHLQSWVVSSRVMVRLLDDWPEELHELADLFEARGDALSLLRYGEKYNQLQQSDLNQEREQWLLAIFQYIRPDDTELWLASRQVMRLANRLTSLLPSDIRESPAPPFFDVDSRRLYFAGKSIQLAANAGVQAEILEAFEGSLWTESIATPIGIAEDPQSLGERLSGLNNKIVQLGLRFGRKDRANKLYWKPTSC